MMQLSSHKVIYISLLVIGLAGAVLLAYATPQGMGLVNDSVGYIGGARNLVDGNGYSRLTGNGEPRPITNYPPLYSIVLAVPILLGVDSLAAAWVLNLVLFGMNSILVGWMVYQYTKSFLFGIFASVLFILSIPFFKAHTFALSEPVFIFVYLLAIYLFTLYLSNNKIIYLVLVGILSSLAVLTRYVGLSLFITFCVLLIVYKTTWRERISTNLIFLAAGLPLIMAWMVRNFMVTGNAANRQFIFHPIPRDKLEEGLSQFWGWLLPDRGNLVERFLPYWGWVFAGSLILLLAFVLFALWSVFKKNTFTREAWFNPALVIGFQGFMFLVVLISSLLFVDASPPLDERIIIPFTLCFLLLVMGFLAMMWQQKAVILKVLSIVITIALLFSFSEDTIKQVQALSEDGQGFASSGWQESPTIALVDKYRDRTVYTNKPTALYILINKPAYILLSPTNPATGLPRQDYPEFVNNVRQSIADGRALLVIFDYVPLMADPEEKEWITDFSAGLPVLASLGDDTIFGIE
jgi:4-amino-4-deoxy-L-arabinose transferase-like glycosyltransferase